MNILNALTPRPPPVAAFSTDRSGDPSSMGLSQQRYVIHHGNFGIDLNPGAFRHSDHRISRKTQLHTYIGDNMIRNHHSSRPSIMGRAGILAAAMMATLMAGPADAEWPSPGNIMLHSAGGALQGCSGSEFRIRIQLRGQRFLEDRYANVGSPTVKLSAGSRMGSRIISDNRNGDIQFRDGGDWQDGPITITLDEENTIVRVRNKPNLGRGGKGTVHFSISDPTEVTTTWEVYGSCKVENGNDTWTGGDFPDMTTDGVREADRSACVLGSGSSGTMTLTFEDTRAPGIVAQSAFDRVANRNMGAAPWSPRAPGC